MTILIAAGLNVLSHDLREFIEPGLRDLSRRRAEIRSEMVG